MKRVSFGLVMKLGGAGGLGRGLGGGGLLKSLRGIRNLSVSLGLEAFRDNRLVMPRDLLVDGSVDHPAVGEMDRKRLEDSGE